jgi:hypothetical protein
MRLLTVIHGVRSPARSSAANSDADHAHDAFVLRWIDCGADDVSARHDQQRSTPRASRPPEGQVSCKTRWSKRWKRQFLSRTMFTRWSVDSKRWLLVDSYPTFWKTLPVPWAGFSWAHICYDPDWVPPPEKKSIHIEPSTAHPQFSNRFSKKNIPPTRLKCINYLPKFRWRTAVDREPHLGPIHGAPTDCKCSFLQSQRNSCEIRYGHD